MGLKKKKLIFLWMTLSFFAVVSLLLRPVLACQASSLTQKEGMACCIVQGKCHHSPQDRTNCCTKHSKPADKWFQTIIPIKVNLEFLPFSPGCNFVIVTLPQLQIPSNLPLRILCHSVFPGTLSPEIFLLKSSFLI
jgi:hypothetical protein